jgi:type IV secretory pathway VirB9-like protein
MIMGFAAGALGACATPERIPEPVVPAGHHFDYGIENRESVGLIQVFDDGSRTYLQFREPPAEPVAIEGGSDKTPVGYLNDGPYLVVAGVYDRLEISVGDRSAEVRETSARAEGEPPATTTVSVAPSGATER